MSSTPPLVDLPSSAEELLALRDRLDEIERQLADLGRDVSGRPTCEFPPPKSATSHAPSAAGLGLLFHRIDRLTRRLDQQDQRAAEVVVRLDGHDDILRRVCIALERLDDPYGMGTGLDEWIGIDEPSPESNEEGERP